jgi:hypothetical protein
MPVVDNCPSRRRELAEYLGERVRVHGLSKSPQYNGLIGTVTGEALASDERVLVELDVDKKVLSLKIESLIPVEPAQADESDLAEWKKTRKFLKEAHKKGVKPFQLAVISILDESLHKCYVQRAFVMCVVCMYMIFSLQVAGDLLVSSCCRKRRLCSMQVVFHGDGCVLARALSFEQ